MLGNKRNPFPRIGKIYKYEFINISKILLPLYLLLIILGLLIDKRFDNIMKGQ